MYKRFANVVVIAAAVVSISLSGCGSNSGSALAPTSAHIVSGVAATGQPLSGTVTLRDSSATQVSQMTIADKTGKFSFDVDKLNPPFILSIEAPASAMTPTVVMYSFAKGEGTANINPFSNVVIAAAAQVSDMDMLSKATGAMMDTISKNRQSVIDALKAKLAPLFTLYGVTQDPVSDDFEADGTGLDAMFDNVRIAISKGTIIVTNKMTGGVIFTALVTDIAGGTFYPENLPGGRGTLDGAALYGTDCSSCHGPLATSSKLGATASEIQSAISTVTAMKSLSTLSVLQIQAIASALGAAAPQACTYTYSAWGTCQSNNTQTRTMLTSTPSGCTGTPALSQSCTYVPPAPQPCTYTYSAWGACQSNNTQTRTMLTSTPSGCTGTPALSQSCTYVPPAPQPCTYTYSAWGACQSNNTQTRTMLTSSPSGCTGTPALSQSCTYVPPAPQPCTYTYSAWGTCQSNNTQTRTMLTSSPSGCTGVPVVSQTCTYTPPIDGGALYTQYCSGCHGNGKKGSSATTIQNAINSNRGGMGSLSFLTSAQIAAIAAAP